MKNTIISLLAIVALVTGASLSAGDVRNSEEEVQKKLFLI